MTITDISILLDIPLFKISPKVKELSESMPSLAAKYYKGQLYPNSHFSLEEVEAICEKLELNNLQKIYIHENFKEMPSPDIYEIPGTHKFLEEYKKNQDIQCCNTCAYLLGVTGSHKMPQPYCKVYEKYLESFNAKVYEDWCSSYLKAKLPKPRQWYKETAPVNLNMYGETGTINGIDNSKMMNTERSIKGVVVRVNQVGFDE